MIHLNILGNNNYNRMKIAYLSTFYPYRGGIAQFNASLCRQLALDHDVRPYTFVRQYPNILFPGTSQLVSTDDKVDDVGAERLLDTINPFSYMSTARKIKEFKPDLLLMKYWMPFFAPSLGYVSGYLRKHGIKVIPILDNVIPHEKRPGDIALTKYFLNRTDGYVSMSNTVSNDLLSLKPNARFTMLDHPLYDHFGEKVPKAIAREKLNIPADKKVLLFFGFIRGYKGLDLLISALSNLPEDYYLLIAGEVYGSFSEYQDQIDQLGLGNRIGLNVCYIGDSEVPLFFSASDVLILPYKSATQSGIIGITYHFDLPVIATDVGGLREMIEPHGTGLMANKPTVDIITATINEFFGNDLSNYIRNIEDYKQKCSWSNFAKDLVSFAQSLQ
jgi:glycosyltransferase involved in cell wall biosynthesis